MKRNVQVPFPLIYLVPQSLCNPSYQVEAAIKRLEKFADGAQTDLGMDYAWLDDVTVHDWTRYHDLTRSKFKGALLLTPLLIYYP